MHLSASWVVDLQLLAALAVWLFSGDGGARVITLEVMSLSGGALLASVASVVMRSASAARTDRTQPVRLRTAESDGARLAWRRAFWRRSLPRPRDPVQSVVAGFAGAVLVGTVLLLLPLSRSADAGASSVELEWSNRKTLGPMGSAGGSSPKRSSP